MLDGVVPPILVLVLGFVLLALARLSGPVNGGRAAAIVLAVVTATAALQHQMGRPLTYRHGPVRLWSGDINSDHTSQQLFDPYTFTHVIHGAVFYGLTRPLLRTAPLGRVAAVVTTLEAAWEAYENTDQVVNRYRAGTISLGYYGD